MLAVHDRESVVCPLTHPNLVEDVDTRQLTHQADWKKVSYNLDARLELHLPTNSSAVSHFWAISLALTVPVGGTASKMPSLDAARQAEIVYP